LALVAPLLADDAAPPKDHALFAGATVQVEDGPGYFEIAGVRGYFVSLLADGKLHQLRRDRIRNVRVERSLKLTDVIARIDKMVVTPTSVGPHADLFGDMHMQMLMSDMASDAQDSVAEGTARMETLEGNQAAYAASGSTSPAPSALAAAIAADSVAAQAPLNMASNNAVSMQSMVDGFGHGSAQTGDNALSIGCELSAPRVMHNTYALVLTEFREANGGKSSYNVHVEPIGELGPKPRKVSFTQAGFPHGFSPRRVGLHLYSGSLELATNLSEGRVDLTADDAMRYLVLAYVTSHTKDSLPATPLLVALPADFKQQASPTDLSRTFYVTVGEDGRVQALSAERDRPVAVNPYIDSTVRKFRYEPALKEGKPFATVVEMRLASFLR
jgi:hypothetical protein